jgi:SAM-dependent methyltransferase
MFKHGIAVIHDALPPHTGITFHIDAPKHREALDLTRRILICGWAANCKDATAAKIVCKIDNKVLRFDCNQPRQDAVKQVRNATGLTIDPLCGFNFSVPSFMELELFFEQQPGTPIPLARFSIVPLDAISGVAADAMFLHDDVPLSTTLNHNNFWTFLKEVGNRKNLKVLEIGSRAVTNEGKGARGKEIFADADYTGFDYYPGDNVDVVGDAHRLSHYFDTPFDLILSFAVFEHFAMPWLVAQEIAKCLKVGGLLAIETHFSFSSHERPWHFFQCSDLALNVLFSPALGFECIASGASNPIVGRFSSLADEYLRNRPVTGLYCHSELLARKVRDVTTFRWEDAALEAVVGDRKYPPPKR